MVQAVIDKKKKNGIKDAMQIKVQCILFLELKINRLCQNLAFKHSLLIAELGGFKHLTAILMNTL